jgi:hypothetical protein
MHLRLALNLLHFLPDLGGLYTLRHVPNFYEIHPRSISTDWADLVQSCNLQACIYEFAMVNDKVFKVPNYVRFLQSMAFYDSVVFI